MTAKNRIAKYLWTFIKYFSLILAGFIANPSAPASFMLMTCAGE